MNTIQSSASTGTARPGDATAGWFSRFRAFGAWAPLLPLAVALLTAAIVWPAVWNDFVEWDDYVNLKNNESFRGFAWPQLRWMFTAILMGHYIPVTWLSFALDYVLWGMDPMGYHLTNVLLHAANAAVFYLVALRLLGRALPAARSVVPLCATVAALFFALHPLRAESVAWATERRDVLSGFFALITTLLYLKAAEADGRRRLRLLGAAVATYVLALGSKSIVMTLPLVLLLLDVYPLRRLPARWRDWGDVRLRGVWREKIPFFALAGLGAIVSWYAVAANNFFTPGASYPLLSRMGIAFYSLAFYAWKTLLPIGLTPLYELPHAIDLLAPRFLGSMVAVLGAGLTLLALRGRWPAGLAAATYYVITLAPVSGLIHAGHQLAHDRYSYLSCLGFALLVGAAPAAILRLHRENRIRPALVRVTLAGIGVWLAALAFMTVHQVQVWRDTETLWRYAVDSDNDCSLCHHNLGHTLLHARNMPTEAVTHLERALRLRPDRVALNTSLGVAYTQIGEGDRAIAHFQRVLDAKPTSVEVLVNQAVAFVESGRLEDAHARLRHSLALDKSNVLALSKLGVVLIHLGRAEEGVGHLQRAVELAPEVPHHRLALGVGLLALGRHGEAREQYDVLVSMDAQDARSPAQFLGARLILEW